MTSLSDLARKAGFQPAIARHGSMYLATLRDIERLLALHVEELCAGVEPVAWRTFDGEGGYDFRDFEMNEDYQAQWNTHNPKHVGWVDPLYPASTVAALQARVAELEKWQESAFRAHPNIDLDIEYSRRN